MYLIDYLPPQVEEVWHVNKEELYLDRLNESDKKQVEERLSHYSDELLMQMHYRLTETGFELFDPSIEPVTECVREISPAQEEQGLALLREGKIAALILAGGQGTRLGVEGPKGCVAATPLKKKTLFQLIAEKVKGAARLAGRPLEIAIMTSPLNHAATIAFFKENQFFGLQEEHVTFFEQEMLPLLTEEGALFLSNIGELAEGPNGNGYALHRLFQTKVAEKWREKGIEYVNVIPVDNPLADPFDYKMIALQESQGWDILFKAVEKRDAKERVGVIGERGGVPAVVEYSELPQEEAEKVQESGELLWLASNTGLFSAKLSYIEKIGREKAPMPWHLAEKRGKKVIFQEGEFKQTLAPHIKFEAFIFDAFRFTHRFGVLLADRRDIFSPIKGPTGADSLESALLDLAKCDRRLYEELTGEMPPSGMIELDPSLYYLSPSEKINIKESIINDGNYFAHIN